MPGIARGYRRSSLVIGAVIVFVLGGLYATDRALTQASRERLRVDAAESATLVESFLSQRAEALVALRAIYADGQVSNHRAALSEYTVALTDFLPGIRRLWIADSSGKIVDDVAVYPPRPSRPTTAPDFTTCSPSGPRAAGSSLSPRGAPRTSTSTRG